MDFAEELGDIARRAVTRAGDARAILVAPVSPGAGASTVARSLARLASDAAARPVWLIDLDFAANPQASGARLNGAAYNAELGGERFWRTEPDNAGRLALRKLADAPVFISRFERERGSVRRIVLRRSPEYWSRVRRSCALAVVDAPFACAGLEAVAADMDGVILVGDARFEIARAAEDEAARIEEAGGRVLGLIVNRAEPAR